MIFLLTALKIVYVLDPNLPTIPSPRPEDSDSVKAERIKRGDDELVCRGYIMNYLTDRLYDLYRNLTSPREIWTTLETKYKNEKKGTDKFLALRYFEFVMTDNMPIMDQVHELQILVSKLAELEIKIPDSLQVGAILSKLPPTWNEYRKKILLSPENFTIEKFFTHLQIEAENRARDVILLNSKIHYVGESSRGKNNNKLKVQKKGKLIQKVCSNEKGTRTMFSLWKQRSLHQTVQV